MARAPRCFTVGSLAQGTARGSSRAGRRPAPGWSGGLAIASLSLQQYPTQDSLAEWSKALASGASPQGRGFEPHSCQLARRQEGKFSARPLRYTRPGNLEQFSRRTS